MLNNITKCNHWKPGLPLVRLMTTAEIAAALRPFYFFVHPDLFAQHPNQQITNENSLKRLHCFIESIQLRKTVDTCKLHFYLREKTHVTGNFNLVQIELHDRDVKATILNVLKACQLPTDHIEKPPQLSSRTKQMSRAAHIPSYVDGSAAATAAETFNDDDYDDVEGEMRTQEPYTLKLWLDESYPLALELWERQRPIRESVLHLQKQFIVAWQLADIRWETGWNEQHFHGCLTSLQVLAKYHPDLIDYLKGRIVVFGAFTGVSLDGHIFLNSGEVRHNWIDVIRKIPSYDLILKRIPAFEKTVSQVLRDIRVVRRKFMPKIVAGEYERQLLKLTTSMSDYWGRNNYPKNWPKSLSNYEIVVESASGPLMVSPTGQFIAPSSCPPFLLVPFITEKLEEAASKMMHYQRNKHIERFLTAQCIQQLQLIALDKADNVSPDDMIECCARLIKHAHDLTHLNGLNLTISNYYSVLTNGFVCIPWNWTL